MTKKILVVGRGLVGSAFKDDDRFVLKSHADWWLHLNECAATDPYRGFVCAAGLAGQGICKAHTMDEVMTANVSLPCNIAEVAFNIGVPCISLSTAGVYKDSPATEADDTEPWNRYIASKIAMEHALTNFADPFIFRLPWVDLQSDHPRDFGQKIRLWHKCEAVETSIVYKKELVDSVINAVNGDIEPDIYNIASISVWQAVYIRQRYGWQGDVVAKMEGTTPCAVLDTTKAREAGLI